jgi:hypothetical protein
MQILRKKSRSLMGRLSEAYVSLLVAPENTDGSRAVLLARCGRYEVRLVEFPEHATTDESSLWLTLYRRDIRSVLDSRHCEDLDHAETLAANLLWRANQLDRAHV